MNQGPGWISRVFGNTAELEQRVHEASRALAEKDRRLMELERQLELVGSEAGEKARKALELERQLGELLQIARGGASRGGEGEVELVAALRRGAEERTALEAALTEATAKLNETEAALAKKVEREAALSKTVATQGRRADLLSAELEALRKQLAKAEASAQAALSERGRLEAALRARDVELTEKTDMVCAAEWKIATLENETAQARSELHDKAREHDLHAESTRREQARVNDLLEQRQTLLLQTRELLFDVSRLSAHALHRTLGAAAHLAIELAAGSCVRKEPRTLKDSSEAVLELGNRLALLGVAEDFTARPEEGGYVGRFKITGAVPEGEYAGLARWVAAYAVEALNDTTAAALRLEALQGGPTEFQFLATPRRPVPFGSRAKSARPDEEPSEAMPSELDRAV